MNALQSELLRLEQSGSLAKSQMLDPAFNTTFPADNAARYGTTILPFCNRRLAKWTQLTKSSRRVKDDTIKVEIENNSVDSPMSDASTAMSIESTESEEPIPTTTPNA